MSVKVVTNLNTNEDPCNEDPDYDFHKCVESVFYQQNGCQYPWNVYEYLDIPVCSNLTLMKDLVMNVDRNNITAQREKYSNLQRIAYTKGRCKKPCVTKRYRLMYQNNEEEMSTDTRQNHSLMIVFDNYKVEKRQELQACDSTCVIGELGGNLGFFLGGSILALLDIIIFYASKLHKVSIICKKLIGSLRQLLLNI